MKIIVTAVAVWVTTLLPLGVSVSTTDDQWWARALVYLAIATVMVVVNAIVKPIVNFVTAPIRFLTLGLFSLVIGWAMLWLASWLTGFFSFGQLNLDGGFWKTLLAAVVIAITAWLLSMFVPKKKKND